MKIQVWLDRTSQPLEHDNVKSSYQKGDLFCVYTQTYLPGTNTEIGEVVKYPILNIFRIVETYK